MALKQAKGSIYLIPNTLGGESTQDILPQEVMQIATQLRVFAVEEIKSARRLIRQLGIAKPMEEIDFRMLNEHTQHVDFNSLIEPLFNGIDVGLVSEAGVPCVADPGSQIVELAHEAGIKVEPLVGPSSILLALMASGMNGQQFSFNGYLPRERADRIRKIKQLEQLAKSGITQLFMDAPYRNNQVLEDVLASCNANSKLCIASNITCDNERINTKTMSEWSQRKPDINKMPVMFVMGK
jgi:16S rRNA (cytidine1402-2'-O)-methyltransferase